jgi:large subunit ribosomal protein L29
VKAAGLRDLPYDKLAERLAESKEELFNLRFQLATNQLDNTARLREVRREIARIGTVMREQEIEAYYSQQEEGVSDD